jgi:hypothetical protein
MPAKPVTITGSLANDAAQIGVGLIGFSKLTKAWQALGTGAKIVKGMAVGAMADATVFEGNEERLSNLLEKYPTVAQPVFQFLAARPDDHEALGRFKNALEGMGIGLAMEGILYGVRVAKAYRAGDKEGAMRVLEELDEASEKARAKPSSGVPQVDARFDKNGEIKRPTAPKQDDIQGDLFGKKHEQRVDGPDVSPQPWGKPSDEPTKIVETPKGEAHAVDADGQYVMDVGEMPIKDVSAEAQAVSARAPQELKLVSLDEAQVKKVIDERNWQDHLVQGNKVGQGALWDDNPLHGINLRNIQNAGQLEAELRTVAKMYGDKITTMQGGDARGVRSWEAVNHNAEILADEVGTDVVSLLQHMQITHKNVFHMDASMRLYRDALSSTGQKVRELADAVANKETLPQGYASRAELIADFGRAFEMQASVQGLVKGIQTNIARAQGAMRMTARPRDQFLTDDMLKAFPQGEEAIERVARAVIAAGDDPKALAKITRPGFVARLTNAASEFFINSVMSSPKSWVVNTVSSAANAAWLSAERMVAGSLRAHSAQGRAEFHEGALQFASIGPALIDSLKLAQRAFKENRTVLDPVNAAREHGDAISAKMFDMDGTPGKFMDAFGHATRIPSRMMMTSDEFVKQVVYRSHVRARAMREAADAGLKNDPGMFAAYVADKVESAFDTLTGRGINEEALEMARKATFSNSLEAATWSGGRTFGQSLQQMTANHPALRLVLPFVRTPTNIARWFWDRTPILNATRYENFKALRGDYGASGRAEVVSRSMTGAALLGTATWLAASGKITGDGPVDKEQRKALTDAGWQPNSVWVSGGDGKDYPISFARLDPFSTFFSLVANFHEIGGHLRDGTELDKVALAMMTSVGKLAQNKTYLQGLTNTIQALAEPGKRGERFVGSLTSSFVPSIAKDFADRDGALNEVRTILDHFKARLPGFNETLDPTRNIYGEKVLRPAGIGPDFMSPFLAGVQGVAWGSQKPVSIGWQKEVQKDFRQEVARQSYLTNGGLSQQPTQIEGVDLTNFRAKDGFTAAHRLQQLVGEVRKGGKTITEALKAKVESDYYQTRLQDGQGPYDGSRLMHLQRIIGRYRDKAEKALFKEMPEVEAAVKMARYNQNVLKRAKPSGAQVPNLDEISAGAQD